MFNLFKILASTVFKKSYHKAPHKQCPTTNPFAHKEGGYKIYKYLTYFVGFPAIMAVAAMTYINRTTRCEERLPFAPYEYMRRRTKRFPWGDGDRSFFHNPAINPLPDGYEVEQEECLNKSDEERAEEDCPK